jgi:hypothetical protein
MVIQRLTYPLTRDLWILKKLINDKLYSRKMGIEDQFSPLEKTSINSLFVDKIVNINKSNVEGNGSGTSEGNSFPKPGQRRQVPVKSSIKRRKKSLLTTIAKKKVFEDFDNDDDVSDDDNNEEETNDEEEQKRLEADEELPVEDENEMLEQKEAVGSYSEKDSKMIESFRHLVSRVIHTLYYFYTIFIGKVMLIGTLMENASVNNTGCELVPPSETTLSEPVKPFMNVQQNLFVLNSKLTNFILLLFDGKSSVYYEVVVNGFSLNSLDPKRVFQLNGEWIGGLEVCAYL